VSGEWHGPPGTYQKIVQIEGKLELRDRHGGRRVFDPSLALRLADVFDVAGNRWSLSYAADGRLLEVRAPFGQAFSLGYDENVASPVNPFWQRHGAPILTSVTDAAGRTATLSYELETGRLVAIHTPGGSPGARHTTSLSYDADDRIGLLVDANGNPYARVAYDTAGRVVAQHDADNARHSFHYHAGITMVEDPNGSLVEWRFGANGVAPRVVPSAKIEHTRGLRPDDPPSYVTTYAHSANDELTSVAFPNGNRVSYAYDEFSSSVFARGNLLSETRHPGPLAPRSGQSSITTRYAYHSACNKPVTIVDPRGNDAGFVPPNGGTAGGARYTTSIEYDATCNPVSIRRPVVNPAGRPDPLFSTSYENQAIAETFTYNAAGQLLTRTDPAGVVERRTYYASPSAPGKPAGFLASVTADDGLGRLSLTTTFEYATFGAVRKVTDPKGNVRSLAADERGRITEETGPDGVRTRRAYDANDNVVALHRETAAGSGTFVTTDHVHDAMDRVVATIHRPAPGVLLETRYAYDANGNLVSRTGPSGETKTFAYDERNLVLSASGPSGGTFAYDANGNLKTRTDPLGRTTRYEHDGYDRQVAVVDAHGSRFSTAYDPAGNAVLEQGVGGTSGRLLYERRIDHDEANRAYRVREWLQSADSATPASVGTSAGRWVKTLQEPDARGLLRRAINDNGHATSHAYDAVGRLVSTTDPLGNAVSRAYDRNGNVVRVTETAAGSLPSAPCPQRCTTEFSYDANDKLVLTRNPDGSTRSNQYDARGNVVQTVDEKGNVVLHEYDDMDRLVRTRRAMGTSYVTTTVEWDSEGRLQRMCDDAGECTSYLYVPGTRLVRSTIPPPTAGPSTTNDYDAAGNLVAVTYASGKVVNVAYDALNRPVRVELANSGVTNPKGTTRQTFAYDDLGRVVLATDNGVAKLGAGVATSLQQVPLAQRYDTLGRVLEESQLGLPVIHTMDGVGNVLTTRYPSADGRTVARSYDANERLDRTWDSKGLLAKHSYLGLLTIKKSFGGPEHGLGPFVARTTFFYDNMQRPTGIVHDDGAGTPRVSLSTRYDVLGNRLAERIEGPQAASPYSQLYVLDDLSRARSWKRGILNAAQDAIVDPREASSWPQIDGQNNWRDWSDENQGACVRHTESALTDDSPLRSRYVLDWCPAASPSTRIYQFDADGNLRDDHAYRYEWDFLNRLVRVENRANGELVVAYAYDAFNRRVVKVFPDNVPQPNGQANRESWYTFYGQHVVQESQPYGSVLPNGVQPTSPNVHVIRQWVYGPGVDNVLVMDVDRRGGPNGAPDGRSAIGPGDERYYYLIDSGANVLGIANEQGNVVEGYVYEAYGAPTILVPANGQASVRWDGNDAVSAGTYGSNPALRPYSPAGNLWFFTGRQYDPESGLYNYRARHYHPDLGQFMSADPIGNWGDPANLGNAYAYVGNNPGSLRDPSGLCPWCPITAGIGAGIGFGLGVWQNRDRLHQLEAWGEVGLYTGVGAGAGLAIGTIAGSGAGVSAFAAMSTTATATRVALTSGAQHVAVAGSEAAAIARTSAAQFVSTAAAQGGRVISGATNVATRIGSDRAVGCVAGATLSVAHQWFTDQIDKHQSSGAALAGSSVGGCAAGVLFPPTAKMPLRERVLRGAAAGVGGGLLDQGITQFSNWVGSGYSCAWDTGAFGKSAAVYGAAGATAGVFPEMSVAGYGAVEALAAKFAFALPMGLVAESPAVGIGWSLNKVLRTPQGSCSY